MPALDLVREQSFERALPNSAEAERAILGAILLDNRLMDQALTQLRPEDFYVPSHRRIYLAMIALHENRTEIDPILIGNELRRENALESAGGISFITNLTYGLPHTTNISHYAKVVRKMETLRWIVKETNKFTAQALEAEDEPEAILADMMERVSEAREKMAVKDQQGGSIQELGERVIDYLYTVKAGINPAMPTAFSTLNQLTGGGVQQGEMRGTAALSSRGKTAMLLQDLRYSAKQGEPCILFSLEMKALFIALRCLGAETGVPINKIKPGMSDGEIDYLITHVQKHFTYPLTIYTDCRSVQDIHHRIRMFKRKCPNLKRVGIDYYGKLSGYGRGRDRYENRTQELKYIADYLQQEIAIGENVALDVPAQFNRSAWGLKDPGPQNIDGGEAYFQACDLFAVLQTETDKAKPGTATVPASLAVHKQRNGPTAIGKEKLKYMFHREKMEFYPAIEDEGDADEGPAASEEASRYL